MLPARGGSQRRRRARGRPARPRGAAGPAGDGGRRHRPGLDQRADHRGGQRGAGAACAGCQRPAAVGAAATARRRAGRRLLAVGRAAPQPHRRAVGRRRRCAGPRPLAGTTPRGGGHRAAARRGPCHRDHPQPRPALPPGARPRPRGPRRPGRGATPDRAGAGAADRCRPGRPGAGGERGHRHRRRPGPPAARGRAGAARRRLPRAPGPGDPRPRGAGAATHDAGSRTGRLRTGDPRTRSWCAPAPRPTRERTP